VGENEVATRKGRRSREAGDATRARILEAALEVFSERGFEGAKTREIAARSGTNLGLIKYYFDSKEKLWRAAVDRVFDALAEVLASALPAKLDADALARIVRELVRFVARNPAFVRVMNDEGRRASARMRWLADRHQKPLYETMAAILRRARAQGLPLPDVPPVHLFYVVIGAVGMIFSQAPECERLTGTDPTASEEAIEAHADAVIALLLGGFTRRSGRRGR
jgi:TetR/AcrR family transcriptional regulator